MCFVRFTLHGVRAPLVVCLRRFTGGGAVRRVRVGVVGGSQDRIAIGGTGVDDGHGQVPELRDSLARSLSSGTGDCPVSRWSVAACGFSLFWTPPRGSVAIPGSARVPAAG